MKTLFLILSSCIAVGLADGPIPAGKYLWDFLKPALSAEEVSTLVDIQGESYPKLSEIPDTRFRCSSQKQPGFYADMDTRCQVFHRCDQAGEMTNYLCVNSTIFNQITLICDAWFNVECERSDEFVDFSNSRLYTDKPLFESPPADYVPPGTMMIQKQRNVPNDEGSLPSSGAKDETEQNRL